MSTFALWMIGATLIAIGIAVAMLLLGVMREWVVVFAFVVAGTGAIVSALHRNKRSDPPLGP